MHMHPKPLIRHNAELQPVTYDLSFSARRVEPFHIRFRRDDGATQLLTMDEADARLLMERLAALLKWHSTDPPRVPQDIVNLFNQQLRRLTH